MRVFVGVQLFRDGSGKYFGNVRIYPDGNGEESEGESVASFDDVREVDPLKAAAKMQVPGRQDRLSNNNNTLSLVLYYFQYAILYYLLTHIYVVYSDNNELTAPVVIPVYTLG